MKSKLIFIILSIALLAGCSFLKRDKDVYRDSDSVNDLAVPPELKLPERDENYNIPDLPEEESETDAEEGEQTEGR